jgi:hypothetical protein
MKPLEPGGLARVRTNSSRLPGMVSVLPAWRRFLFLMCGFARIRAETVVPCLAAMLDKVSPQRIR